MAKMGVKNCYVRLPLVLFLLIKLLVLKFLCSVLYLTFFQGEKNLFSLLRRKRRLKWRVEELRRRAANTNWSFLNVLMIELKGFSRFTKEGFININTKNFICRTRDRIVMNPLWQDKSVWGQREHQNCCYWKKKSSLWKNFTLWMKYH